jgi:hypothetical protein
MREAATEALPREGGLLRARKGRGTEYTAHVLAEVVWRVKGGSGRLGVMGEARETRTGAWCVEEKGRVKRGRHFRKVQGAKSQDGIFNEPRRAT